MKKAQKEAERLAKAYDRIVLSGHQFIDSQHTERRALGMTEEAANRLRYEQELLNRARRAGIDLTPKQSAELQQLARDMAAAEAATEKATDALDFAKDATNGFMSDLRSGLEQGKGLWKSFGDAALGVLDKIIDKIQDDLIDALFQANSAGGSGGGGIGGLIMKGVNWLFGVGGGASDPWAGLRLPGNANGTDYWRGGPTWVGERGPEIVNLPRGASVTPNHRLRGVVANSNAPAGYNDNRVYHIDARGAQRGVGEEIVAAIKEYDKGRLGRLKADLPNLRRRSGSA